MTEQQARPGVDSTPVTPVVTPGDVAQAVELARVAFADLVDPANISGRVDDSGDGIAIRLAVGDEPVIRRVTLNFVRRAAR